MGVARGMQPPWGLAANVLLILVAHITSNVALRVEPATEEFPLLMPRVHPHQAESYLCTPIRVDTDVTYSITGFRPNATKMTAHHMHTWVSSLSISFVRSTECFCCCWSRSF